MTEVHLTVLPAAKPVRADAERRMQRGGKSAILQGNMHIDHYSSSRARQWVLIGFCLSVLLGIFAQHMGQGLAAVDCDGKPYGYPGCPLESAKPAPTAPATCGNYVVDQSEECDRGNGFNGAQGSVCNQYCQLRYCGDGKVDADLGEKCEYETERYYARDPDSGQLIVEERFAGAECGKYCEPPHRTAAGDLVGGCQWVFTDPCSSSSASALSQTEANASQPAGTQSSLSKRDSVSSAASSGTNALGTVHCGNSVVEGPEECDDGNLINADSCTNTCKNPRCGDGVVQSGEECDDTNQNSADSCTNSCKLPRCGDGVVQSGEQCDDGNQIATDTCTANCQLPTCGDSFVQAGEQCDDGNVNNADGCTNGCQITRCGDGVVQGSEECDDGNKINSDTCSNGCRLPHCGDGIVQAGEECDDGNRINADACTNTCRLPRCGDGILQFGEECDDANQNNFDACNSLCKAPVCGNAQREGNEECDDGNKSNADACTNTCRLPVCGNGVQEGGEECDHGLDNSDLEPDACRRDCKAPYCGDQVKDSSEQCDGGPDCYADCTLKNAHALVIGGTGATGLIILGTLTIGIGVGAFFLRKKLGKLFGAFAKGAAKSIDDIPLDEIEMPWHKW